MSEIIFIAITACLYLLCVIIWIVTEERKRIRETRAFFKWLDDRPPTPCIYTMVCEAAVASAKVKSEVAP